MKDDFYNYRLQKGYSLKTIKSQNCYLNRFKSWLIVNGLNIELLNSEKMLECLSWFRAKNSASNASLCSCLRAIRIYLDYQVEKGVITHNPALVVKVRCGGQKVKAQSLSVQKMEDIYGWFISLKQNTEKENIVHKRDIVVLGLLLFQGLDSGDLERLTVKDIDLQKGTVYVPSSRRNAARKIKLESIQILYIQEYLQAIRTKVLRYQAGSDKLFPQSKLQDIVSKVVEKLKKQYSEIENPRHIRSSVIMNWLKIHHIRQVQYMAGHRRVSSTEKYQKEDLHDLAGQLNKYHPMK